MDITLLFRTIDNLYPKYVKVWEGVCNIESPTSYKKGVDAVGAYFIRMAKEKGWDIEVFEQAVAGNVVCITANPNADERPITFSGHIDTVYPLGMFPSPAVRLDDEKIYGPGVSDCKGGVVASFMAMDALCSCGFETRPLQLILQSDEETGSMTSELATVKYICEKAKNSIVFFNCENQAKPGTAVIVRKGIVRYMFKIKGRAVHSFICTHGANAIAEAAHKIIKLESLKDENGITCNCGIIQGGSTPNTVADECSFSADIRFATDSQFEEAQAFAKEVALTSTIDGCSCEIEQINFRPPMELCQQNIDLLNRINGIFKNNGLTKLSPTIGIGGSDAAYITQARIPCVDCMVIEGGRIHSTDEYAILNSLAVSAKYLAVAAANI